ncbi:S9 family peptidase [Actinacidiphila guanduensis]|uniref:Dipeptidyl aminopeptidase/acylaminoacyl peptidase n=1 Tax=Actinacidiphila guanduensis TaxID=310781 RepID=A0A1H0PYW8_9ACTN|nr:S9 family peptidase [Actinacidiphila guanduensis]SDP10377.1 Dipeptidyl aminopeptidase/acylaminoacyl peptidase [Actinacidiphila guanduensis]
MSAAAPQDLTSLHLAGSPAIHPDGGRVVASVQTVDPATLRYRSRLWTFATGRPPTTLTDAGPWSDVLPAFSPDGRHLAFVSDRDGPRRAWLMEADGTGTPLPVDGIDARVTEILWLDADRLLVVAERPAPHAEGAPVVIDWLGYKSDGGGGPLEPTGELWLAGPDGTASLLLASSERLRCPATDGRDVYYAASPRHSDLPEPGCEVRRLPLDGGPQQTLWRCASPVRALAVDTKGAVFAVASNAAGQSVTPPRVWLVAGPGVAEPHLAFPDADLECERAVLSDCRPRSAPRLLATAGEEVLFVATVGEEVALFSAPPSGEPARISPPGLSVTDFDAVAGSVALCQESAAHPIELYLDGARLSALNTAWVASVRPVAPEPVTVAAFDGLPLHGLLYRSATGEGRVLVRVHGGPHLASGNSFDLETQTQVAAGYHVLVPNIRGSAGRGAAFRALSVGEWGRADHRDLLAFADWAVHCGLADPGQLYLAGGSYGGYLINWTLTRTDRFRAAVSERSVTNLLSKYGTSDNGFTVNRYEFGGLDLFDAGARELLDRSPLHHAARITTPLLLVHGERDERCPIEQSEQLFTALRRLGRDVVFVRLPGESHGYSASGRPDRRIERMRLIIEWLDTHREPDRH